MFQFKFEGRKAGVMAQCSQSRRYSLILSFFVLFRPSTD